MRAGNLMGVAFPLFTQPMYARLGIHWASTLFGCIAVAMVPIPYVSPVHLAFIFGFTQHRSPLWFFGVCAARSRLCCYFRVFNVIQFEHCMLTVPQVLLFLGPKIRARSRFASTVVHQPSL
jgi:hypothetical protein